MTNNTTTNLYFVRHAQPDYRVGEDSTYSLSDEGMADRLKTFKFLKGIKFDYAVSSPYKRSFDTIKPIADKHNLQIITDIRLRERDKGEHSNNEKMFRKRWGDFSYHEENGESLGMVQKRNIDVVLDILKNYKNKNILIGTHGTALSTIINYYEPDFNFDSFMRIINYMPYVVCLIFDGETYIGKKELGFVEKKYHGKK